MTPVDIKHTEPNSFNQFVLHFRYLPNCFSIILSKVSEHEFSKSKAFICGLFVLTALSGT